MRNPTVMNTVIAEINNFDRRLTNDMIISFIDYLENFKSESPKMQELTSRTIEKHLEHDTFFPENMR